MMLYDVLWCCMMLYDVIAVDFIPELCVFLLNAKLKPSYIFILNCIDGNQSPRDEITRKESSTLSLFLGFSSPSQLQSFDLAGP